METQLSEIRPKDQLLIRTANSEYRFRVTDAKERRGRLTGGTLGAAEREAVLAGTVSGTGNLKSGADALIPGGRAVFYLAAGSGVERLITSVITRLSHYHADDSVLGAL